MNAMKGSHFLSQGLVKRYKSQRTSSWRRRQISLKVFIPFQMMKKAKNYILRFYCEANTLASVYLWVLLVLLLNYEVAECIICPKSYQTMIIEREVSTVIMLILIVSFDQGNQSRMRRDSQRLLDHIQFIGLAKVLDIQITVIPKSIDQA